MIKLVVASLLLFTSIGLAPIDDKTKAFNSLSEQYVRLALAIGQYDPDFVDAYYGPDSLQPTEKPRTTFPKDSLLLAVKQLQQQVNPFTLTGDELLNRRAKWMNGQLTAFARRIKIASGEYDSFDKESKELFGIEAPHFTEAHFASVVRQLDSLLPGTAPLTDRIAAFSKGFIIPKDKLDTVFKAAIAEARKRTLSHFSLPEGESFTIEYVTNKPWSGYNWYKGNYKSVIQINTDLSIYIERAIDLACHEGYPGHHVYNALLEKNLYRDKGWAEISLYPLFSPQSLIAEGSANYGIEVAFPGEEKNTFATNVLFPLAGIKKEKAAAYFRLLQLKSQLSYARNEAARQYLDGTMTEDEALKWLTNYSLYSKEAAVKSLSFIKKYRSYVINYNYGQDIVMNYIESHGGTADNPQKRWQLFQWLLSNPVTPQDLLGKQEHKH